MDQPDRSAAAPSAAEVMHGPRTVRQVALTFHASGNPALAERLLNLVERAEVRISVFAVGTWLIAHPEMAQRVLRGGHDLGNHTMHHRSMRRLVSAEAHREVAECAEVLRRLTGTPGRWFRASGTHRTTPLIRAAAAAAGYDTCVSYDVDGRDSRDPPPSAVVRAVLDGVQPGSIISLTFGHRSTLTALPPILRGLAKRRLAPVPLSDLLT
jgi:peptidoglycan/xylan/chitin deacetylase (PgdA/CDA1 family)